MRIPSLNDMLKRIFAALFALLVVGLSAPAHAQQVIYVDGSASGAGDGSSWADAYTNLQTAIDNAAAGDQIWIAEGIYKPTGDPLNRDASFTIPASKDGLKLYGGFEGEATETRLADRDPDAHEVVLSGDIDGRGDRAFAPTEDSDGIPETATATDHINFRDIVNTSTTPNTFIDGANSKNVVRLGSGITAATVIDGVTITGGFATVPDYRATDAAARNSRGGGLFCDGCSATFRGVTIKGNHALAEGGGVSVDGGGSPTFINAVFWGNSAGGSAPSADPSDGDSPTSGLHRDDIVGDGNSGLSVNSGSATLIHVTFLQNSINRFDYEEQTGAGDVLSGSGVTVQNGILTSGCPSGATCQNTVSSNLDLSGLRPGPQSSAIGAGDPSFLPADSEDLDDDGNTTEPLPLDAGADARVQRSFPDAGAFETDHQFFSAATGAVAPGETLVITGQRLDQVTAVAVNGTDAPDFTSVSAQRLEATVPQAATTGPVTLTIDGTDGDTDQPVPVIDAYGPGRALGGFATVELPDESAFDFASSFTISAWMKGDAIVRKGTEPSLFRLRGGLFEVYGEVASWKFEDNPATDGAWHHITGVYDEQAGEVRVYVDGEQSDASGTLPGIGEPDLNDEPVTIETNLVAGIPGSVDNVRFYTRALSDGEIQDLTRRHRRLDVTESKANGLLASYRFDAAGGTAYDYAGRRSGTYTSGGPTAFSTAPIGIEQGTTVGPAGAQLVSNVAAYRYGRLGGPARTDGDPGEAFSTEILTEPTERANLTWGLIEDAGSTTIDYGNVGVSAPVGLLYRTGPGDDWEVADGWTRDAAAKTFTASSAPAGEYAVASFPTADLALTLTADQEDVPEGQPDTFTATVTNNGPDAVPSGVTVSFTPTGLGSLSATGGPFSDDTWTLDALNSGASATLTLEGTAATGTDVHFLQGAINASDTDATNNSAGTALSYGSGRSLTLNGSAESEHVSTGRTSSELDLDTSQPVTVEAWIRWDGAAHEPASSDGAVPIVGLNNFDEDDAVTATEYIGLDDSGALKAGAYGATANTQLTPNQWYHVAFVYSGGQWTYYVNGTPDGTASDGLPSNREVWVGKSADSDNGVAGVINNTHYFGGQIDQLRIWSAALTQREIRARMHQTIGEGDPGREDLTLSYRFDGSGSTVTSNAGTAQGTLQGGAGRPAFSSAPLGQQSALATPSSDATVGPSGSALSASVVSGDPVQLYRYGAEDGAVRDGSDAGDDFSALPDFISERSDLVWGVDAPKDASPSATLTLDYSHVGTAGPLTTPVNLLHRERPGDPWDIASGWTKDPAAQTFTHTGPAPTGQYALAEFPKADLAVSLAPASQDVRIGDDAAFTVTVTNTGPDAAPAGTAVALTAITGLADPSAVSAPSSGSYDAANGTWTLGALASGASATLEVTSTYNGTTNLAVLGAALTPPSDAVDLEGDNHNASAQVELAIKRFHVSAAAGNDANSGESWAQAFATLSKALDVAQTQDTIWVAEGVYYPDEGPGVTTGDRTAAFTITGAQDGLHVYGGFSGNESSLGARDPSAHPTVLSGNIGAAGDSTDNSYTVLHLDGTSDPITRATRLDGLTIAHGTANGSEAQGNLTQQGAGLFCNGNGGDCSPALSNLRVTDNASTSWGAGIMIDGTSGDADPRITGTVIANNRSTFQGGGLFVKATDSQPDLYNTVIANNTAGQKGGGLFVRRSTRTDLVGVTFTGNTATEGGAIYNQFTSGSAGPVLQNSLLWNNGDTNSGAEMVSDDASATLSHTLIAGGLSGIVEKNGATTTNGGGNLSSPPQFVNATDPNGFDDAFGTTDDGLRLLPGSPALDVGDGNALPTDALDLDGDGDTSELLPIDLTGANRVQDGTVDLGAYEGGTPALAFDAFAPTAAAPGETVTIIGTRLTNTSEVTIGGTDASFTVESSTEVTVTIPDDATTGPVKLTMNGQTVSGATDLGVVDAPYGPENALTFDGATDGSGAYVQAPTDVLDTTAPFTVEAWIKWDGSDGFRAFFSKPDGGTSSGVALVVFDGELVAGLDPAGSGPTRSVSLTSTPANEWVHVATTYDGTAQALYVNGERVDAATYTSEAFTTASNEPVLIGREFLPGFLNDRTFPGQIDQVRTWDAVLTQEQIRARMHRTIARGTPAASNLVASYRFDAGSGGMAFDYVGPYAGTRNNSPTWTPVSGARLGQESAVATNGAPASVGPADATLTAANVSAGDTVQLYRYGSADGPTRTTSNDGDDLSGVYPTERANLTWGIARPDSSAPTATLTLSYGGVQSLSGTVDLLRRDAPGAPWTRATAWTHDPANQRFTFSGPVPTGEYAVATRPPIHVDAANGDDANPGTSWDQPFATLTKALNVATGIDEIWIAEGTYHPDEGPGVTADDRTASFTITGAQDGLKIYGGFANGDAFADRAPTDHPVVLSGDVGAAGDASDNSYTVVYLDGTTGGPITPATALRGLTVADGYANGDSAIEQQLRGAGMYCNGAGRGNACSPTLAGIIFRNHTATFLSPATTAPHGGALFNNGRNNGASSPHIVNSIFVGNQAQASGGALFNDGAGGTSSPRITNSVFINNRAGVDGGAMYNAGAGGTSNSSIVNSTFVNNSASDGGALFNEGSATDAPSLSNVIVYGNTASDRGDQIANQGVSLTISHSLVEGGLAGISEDASSSTTDGGGNLDSDPQFVDSGTPAGPDGTFGTADDGLRLYAGSPAVDAGDNNALPADAADLDGDGDTSERLPVDLAGAARVENGTVNAGAYEAAASIPLAIIDGSGEGLAFEAQVAPGTQNNPVGILGFDGVVAGAKLNALTITNTAPGVAGISAARLFWSTDQTLEPSSDAVLGTLPIDPASAPATLSFAEVRQPIGATPGYVLLALDVKPGAAASGVQFVVARPRDLAITNGSLRTINGTRRSTFERLPLSSQPTALPVEFARFEVQSTKTGALLSWTTASETNNAGFKVQRHIADHANASAAPTSADRADASGVAWQTVGRVDGAGTTTQPQTYRFRDTALPYAADSIAYRLKQVDSDGSVSFSKQVTMRRGAVQQLRLLGTFPNPARTRATVRFAVPKGADDAAVRLVLYDVLGRQVRTVRTKATAGRHELQLRVGGLASGLYFLRLQAGGRTQTQKITVVQ